MKEKKLKLYRCPRCERETVTRERGDYYDLFKCGVCRWYEYRRHGQGIADVLDNALSPARRLVNLACTEQGQGYSRSQLRFDQAHDGAVRLAISSLMDFYLSDFEVLGRREEWYSLACEGPHGTNEAAARAFEHATNRKPFVLKSEDNPSGRRLHVGSHLIWAIQDKPVRLTVTSFAADGQELLACSYDDEAAYERCPTCGCCRPTGKRRSPQKRVRITLEDLAAHNETVAEAGEPLPAGEVE
jgi:hypothetical protein